MKTLPGIFGLAAVLLLPPIASADTTTNPNLDISCVTRKVDQKTKEATEKSVTTTTKEDWEYVITFENMTFDDMKDLEVKYVIFFKQEEPGSKDPAQTERKSGEGKIDVLKGHDKSELHTVPVSLLKTELAANRYYTNGAKNGADASLAGIWIRVYQNGKLIAEMTRPPNLASKEKWDETP